MIDKGKIPIEVSSVLNTLRALGYESYLVGGSVRDLLLGKEPKDFDICTSAKPCIVKEHFTKVIDTGIKHGTVTVLVGGTAVEVTTFRKSSEWRDGRITSIGVDGNFVQEDVKARDFSINGLLFDGEQVLDFVGGINDLKEKRIKAIGLPEERFKEDPLRMMRAVRLSCQLNFLVEETTIQEIKSNAALLEGAAQERIRDELSKILISDSPAKGIRTLRETGLLKFVVPELELCCGFEQRNPYHDKDVFEHILAVVENTSADLVLRLAALLHDIGKPETFSVDEKGVGHFYYHNIKGQELSRRITTRLKFDHKTVVSVEKLVREHMSKLQSIKSSTVRKLINRVGVSDIYRLVELQIADEAGSAPPHNFEPFKELRAEVDRILENHDPLTIEDLAIGGQDLIGMGFKQGPRLGKVLKELLKRVIDNPEINKKEILINIASKMQR